MTENDSKTTKFFMLLIPISTLSIGILGLLGVDGTAAIDLMPRSLELMPFHYVTLAPLVQKQSDYSILSLDLLEYLRNGGIIGNRSSLLLQRDVYLSI
jgi:hypothetical protein